MAQEVNPIDSNRQQLWQNLDKGTFNLIKQISSPSSKIKTTDVYLNGSPLRTRHNMTTGKMSFNER